MRQEAAPLPLVVSGAMAGGAAAVVSYLALAVVALGAWMLDPGGSQEWSQMLEVASGSWLSGLGLAPTIDGVLVTLLPLGFALVPAVALMGAGRWASDTSAVARRSEALIVALSAAIIFAAVAALVAALAGNLDVSPGRAALVSGVASFVVMLVTVTLRAGVLDARQWPWLVRDALAGATVALTMLVTFSSLLLAVAVVTQVDEMTALLVELDAGPSGFLLLFALTLGYLPIAIVWTMAYVIGPGVTIAVGAQISPFAEPVTGALPGFPLFAALPQSPPPGSVLLPALAVAAGAVAGLALRRRGATGLAGLGTAAFSAVLSGVALAALAWFASGSLGTTSLRGLGPDPLLVGIAGAALVGIGTLVVVALPRRNDHE